MNRNQLTSLEKVHAVSWLPIALWSAMSKHCWSREGRLFVWKMHEKPISDNGKLK